MSQRGKNRHRANELRAQAGVLGASASVCLHHDLSIRCKPQQADISADPDALSHPALRGDPRNTDHTALNHSSQVTNEQVSVIVNRDQGRMLTKTVVEEITI